ncbi:hypothetical protein L535_4113 [Bordetella bronchiseptica SBL-F6116]|nr:hypothetical protein L535_4113 [Bordetella bronchiseptica SBL-F6116]
MPNAGVCADTSEAKTSWSPRYSFTRTGSESTSSVVSPWAIRQPPPSSRGVNVASPTASWRASNISATARARALDFSSVRRLASPQRRRYTPGACASTTRCKPSPASKSMRLGRDVNNSTVSSWVV